MFDALVIYAALYGAGILISSAYLMSHEVVACEALKMGLFWPVFLIILGGEMIRDAWDRSRGR